MSEHDDDGSVNMRVTDKRGAPAPGDEPVVEEADELQAARAQAAQHLDDLQRLKAEFDNYRKRVVKEQTALVERATGALVERLLPMLDNFELALIAADRSKDYDSLVRGVEIVYSELRELLAKEGLRRIEALHLPFDPMKHDAVMHAEGEGDEIVVVEEMRAGYTLGDRVVRPAMVKVGPRKEKKNE